MSKHETRKRKRRGVILEEGEIKEDYSQIQETEEDDELSKDDYLLPDGWEKLIHDNGLPFYYHKPTHIISWTRPYKRRFGCTTHVPPLSAFKGILKFFPLEVEKAEKKFLLIQEAKKKKRESAQRMREKVNEAVLEGTIPSNLSEASDVFSKDPKLIDLLSEETFNVPKLPPEVEAIHNYLIILVAAIVKLEKLRKKRSYEDFLHDTPVLFKKRKIPSELNPEGKTPISFLQEYCIQILKTTPEYKTTIQEDTYKPFLTIVYINGIEYGRGGYLNKRQSKRLAAEMALQKLIPEGLASFQSKEELVTEKTSLQEFMNSSIQTLIDEEKAILLAQNYIKTPLQILKEYSIKSRQDLVFETLEESDNAFKIMGRIGDYEAIATGKSKRETKQRISQLILQRIHPTIVLWKELFPLYSNRLKQLEEEILLKGPNLNILDQIKRENQNPLALQVLIDDDHPSFKFFSWEQRDKTKDVTSLIDNIDNSGT